jgi:hypothetical protein
MKTLYESILDDEDILIGNIKKDTDNPFLLLSLLSEEDKSNEKIVLDIIKRLEFPKSVITLGERAPFNKECLGVKIIISKYGDYVYDISYDRNKELKYTQGYKENPYPNIISEINIIKREMSKKYPDFLLNGNICVGLGYNIDMKEVFGSVTPVRQLLKRWEKKYKVRAVI